jgi:6,7-dimethyl-8-ribityllumazine synthase
MGVNEFNGELIGTGKRFAILVTRFNSLVTEQLVAGAKDCLLRHGAEESAIDLYRVPGAWELPAAAARVAKMEKYDGIIALGCVIRGGTPHFEYVAGEATRGLGVVAREASVPVSLGVLTTDTVDQALERAGTKAGNKGWDAALGVLEMADLFRQME